MAGFEVTLHGRFWVTPEVLESGLVVGNLVLVAPELLEASTRT